MKRLPSNPGKFDLVELFTAVSRLEGYRIDVPSDVEAFKAGLDASLTEALGDPKLLHGKRVEAMFGHVAAALGECRLVKKEDAGAVFADPEAIDLAAPDWSVVTKTGRRLLIEVKNFHMRDFRSKFKLPRQKLGQLKAYADITGSELKIAVYFSRVNVWTLLSPEAFFVDGAKVWIDFAFAMARNEMAVLGDRTINTTPPLTLDFVGDDADGGAPIGIDGRVTATIRGVTMRCGGREIVDPQEQRIALYLMRFGSWVLETPAKVVDGRLVSWSFTCIPEEGDEAENAQEIRSLGTLSSMISSAFREFTVDDGSVVIALDTGHDPDMFTLQIPRDYRGEALPLWQWELRPNFDLTVGLPD
jgi:Holliday junction resolvase